MLDFFKRRDVAVAIMAIFSALLEPLFGANLPDDNVALFLGSLIVLLFSYLAENGLRALVNVTQYPYETWYNSRRLGMAILAFISLVLSSVLPIELSSYLVPMLISLFGYIGIFGYTLQDLGLIVNRPSYPSSIKFGAQAKTIGPNDGTEL